MKGDLNKTDFEILDVLLKNKLTMSELAKEVKIAPVNLWKHIKKLTSWGILTIPKTKRGYKKYPEISDKIKVKKFMEIYFSLVKYNIKLK